MSKRPTEEMKCQVEKWVKETFTTLGYPNLHKEVKLHWRKMYRDLGAATWTVYRQDNKLFGSDFEIIFSSSLWSYLPNAHRYSTVVHECCHIVDILEGNLKSDRHDESWVKLMIKMNCSPKPSYPQLYIPHDVFQNIVPKCKNCGMIGHNKRTCFVCGD